MNSANPTGVSAIVAQQFELGHQISEAGLVPILEPEVTITAPDKKEAEALLLDEITTRLESDPFPAPVMFKLSIPTVDDFYAPLIANPAVLRAAFSDTLKEDGTVSDPIELGPNHNVMIRVTEHTAEQAIPLAQAREQVIAAVRANRASCKRAFDTDKRGSNRIQTVVSAVIRPDPCRNIRCVRTCHAGGTGHSWHDPRPRGRGEF